MPKPEVWVGKFDADSVLPIFPEAVYVELPVEGIEFFKVEFTW